MKLAFFVLAFLAVAAGAAAPTPADNLRRLATTHNKQEDKDALDNLLRDLLPPAVYELHQLISNPEVSQAFGTYLTTEDPSEINALHDQGTFDAFLETSNADLDNQENLDQVHSLVTSDALRDNIKGLLSSGNPFGALMELMDDDVFGDAFQHFVNTGDVNTFVGELSDAVHRANLNACCTAEQQEASPASCNACAAGLSVEDFCGRCLEEGSFGVDDLACLECHAAIINPVTPVVPTPDPAVCCLGLTPTCRACALGLEVEEYCAQCFEQGSNDIGCRGCPQFQTECETAAAEATESGLIGAFIPQCDADGNYMPRQCHGSTGHCFCVDEQGVEIEATRLGPGQGVVDCAVARLSSCQRHALHAGGLLGSFIPSCDEDGEYLPVQCHGSTGGCFCVDEEGAEIEGTRAEIGQEPDCTTARMSECEKQVHEASGLLGAFVPSCDEEGNFSPLQCHGSTGQCFCVDEQGVEIEGTRLEAGEQPDCSNAQLSPCLLAVSEAPHLVGSYVPQCEEDGSFTTLQCHGSTGYCWCVDESGNEVEGSRSGPGSPPNCEELMATPCERAAQTVLGLIGAFVPQCSEDGAFMPRQCHGSTGSCWCVDEQGAEIEGTRLLLGHHQVDCEVARMSECERQVHEASGLLGAFVPSCDEEGNFSPLQCHGSTGQCFCVDEQGVEIEGTRLEAGEQPDCSNAGMPPCLRLAAEAPHLLGSYVPQCEEDGSFTTLQCHGSTGYCWCVDEQGNEVEGSRQGPGNPPDCAEFVMSPCQLAASESSGLLGAFVPECDESGDYSPTQCHGSTGQCFCVDESGVEIEGTRVEAGTQIDCAVARMSACERQALSAEGIIGAFVSSCDEEGAFLPKQCHGSTGQCFCVDEEGVEIEGTRVEAGNELDCTNARLPPCLRVVAESPNLIGSYVPQCEEDGSFTTLQCHGSTGYCWCVDESGAEIQGTRGGPGNAPNCETVELTPCQQAANEATGLIGSFVPSCDENGAFLPRQCHGSIGRCWCVDSNGEALDVADPSEEACLAARLTPCLRELMSASLHFGAFRPQCDEQGNYEPQQCHGSLGSCWCVTTSGEEISGTRTGPGEERYECTVVQGIEITLDDPAFGLSTIVPVALTTLVALFALRW